MKIFIVSSSFPVAGFRDIMLGALDKNQSHQIIYLVRRKEWFEVDWGEFADRINLITHNTFENYNLFNPFAAEAIGTTEIIHEILNDHQTMMLSDRSSESFGNGKGVSNYVRYLTKVISNAITFLKRENPQYVYFRTTPHSALEWCIANVAEKLGICVLVTELSISPWRQSIFKGFRKERESCLINVKVSQNNIETEQNLILQYFEKNQSAYDNAIPTYEKLRLKYNKGKYFNLKNELRKWWKKPDYILNKYKCYKQYFKLSSLPQKDDLYICFFLHYQPERTSLPEGFGFAQQLIAIQTLRSATPSEIKIIVKEHPATFTNKCDPRQRNITFYNDIVSLPGVELVNLEIDTFNFIDASIAVATLTTGSVGRQALLRGKPIIYFGRTVFNEGKGVHKYKNHNDLANFINNCKICEEKDIIEETKKQFISNISYSVSGIDYSQPFEKIDIYKRDVVNTGHLRILKELLDGNINI